MQNDTILWQDNGRNPQEVRNLISQLVEEARSRTGVRGREMFGAEV